MANATEAAPASAPPSFSRVDVESVLLEHAVRAETLDRSYALLDDLAKIALDDGHEWGGVNTKRVAEELILHVVDAEAVQAEYESCGVSATVGCVPAPPLAGNCVVLHETVVACDVRLIAEIRLQSMGRAVKFMFIVLGSLAQNPSAFTEITKDKPTMEKGLELTLDRFGGLHTVAELLDVKGAFQLESTGHDFLSYDAAGMVENLAKVDEMMVKEGIKPEDFAFVESAYLSFLMFHELAHVNLGHATRGPYGFSAHKGARTARQHVNKEVAADEAAARMAKKIPRLHRYLAPYLFIDLNRREILRACQTVKPEATTYDEVARFTPEELSRAATAYVGRFCSTTHPMLLSRYLRAAKPTVGWAYPDSGMLDPVVAELDSACESGTIKPDVFKDYAKWSLGL